MKTVQYRTYWSYLGPSVKRRGTVVDLILDILYLMEDNGIIPPLHVLNEVLQGGGSSGGMGPGTTWKPFRITEQEYAEIVQMLLTLDAKAARELHPYIRFDKARRDEELEKCASYHDWLGSVAKKRSAQELT